MAIPSKTLKGACRDALSMSLPLETLSMAAPEEERSFSRGRFELFTIGDRQIGRAVYAPGWRWSEDVAPIAGTALCEVEHVGLVVSGRAGVKMADGTERYMGPGDLFSIPAGHDSWVLGEEEYVSLHFLGSGSYAIRQDDQPGAANLFTSIGKHNAPSFTWREVCDGWTLLSRPGLHILEEQMPADTRELMHVHERTVQFYFVLDGEAIVEVAGTDVLVRAGEGIEIPPGVPHQMRNDSLHPLDFLVASSGLPRQDRVDIQDR